MRSVVFAFLFFFTTATSATVFRWVDKEGVVHYSDKPQAPDAKPAALPALQTYPAGRAPSLSARSGAGDTDSEAAVPPAPVSGIRIDAPAEGTTIRDAQGEFTIELTAKLAEGQGFIYYLDGKPRNSTPTPSAALLISGLERGEHTIGAALADAGGHELAHAAPVTIYMMPPVAHHP